VPFDKKIITGSKFAGYALCVAILSACAVTESTTSPAAPSAQAAPMAASSSASRAVQSSAIPALEISAQSEQQRLIDEINTDGSRIQTAGLTDAGPSPVNFSGDNVVELNYEQADLRLVLEELADALDINLVIDPSIDNKVSIRTAADRPLAMEDVWPLIRLLSRDAGILLEQVGNVFNARKVQRNLPTEIVNPDTLQDSAAALVMQVTPLTYVSSDAAIEVLGPVLSATDNIRKLTTNNTLIITGTSFELDRVNQLLMLIDADPFSNQGIQIFQLSNANAVEVAEELDEILQLIEGGAPSYQVKGIERINSILVTAPATRGFKEIERWIRILDADSQEQMEQLFYYKVRNLKAVELEQTLTSVFEIDRDDENTAVQNRNNEDDTLALRLVQRESPQPTDITPENPNNGAVSANLRVKIVADEATNSLLVRSSARDYRQLLTTINQLDAVPLQVMINAVIAQVTLTEANEFGVDWSRIAANSVVDDISTSTTTGFLPRSTASLLFSKTFIDGAAQVDATLEAIATNNDVQLLARPTITVMNNQEGEITIGSQVPIQQGQTVGNGGVTTNNIQYRDTGIVLTITPQINNDGIVNLIIRQELSSVDAGAGGIGDNPVFNNQEINTTVVVRNGENIVLGGLIQSDFEDLNTGVPGLSRIPVLGRLFSYQQESLRKQELFIVLRPEIIDLNEPSGTRYSDILDRFEIVSGLLGDGEI
jgi:general secretion pathway protein D